MTKVLLAKLVQDIQKIPTGGEKLRGDGSGLSNVWDDICGLPEIGDYAEWDLYEDMLRLTVDSVSNELTFAQRSILWLATPAGEEWADENDLPESSATQPKPAIDDIANYLYDRLMELATNYHNHRTIAYANRF